MESTRPGPWRRLVQLSACLTLGGIFLGLPTGAQPAPGAIRGSVSNADSKLYLESALVTLPSLLRSTFTDRQGTFHLGGLPPGEHVLRVTYTGLAAQDVTVRVPSGGSASVEVELREMIHQMAAFEVNAEKQGNALAISQQRAADNVKNIVAADAFGSAGEGNVADLLQRLPGITVSYTSADPDQVSIRGVSPELSTVTIDGAPVSNAVAGTARTFRFTITSNISMLESVEVTKALTPDMDASSIGGAINLRSKSPFQSKVTSAYEFQLGGNIETRSEAAKRLNPTVSGSLTRVFGTKRRIGLTLAANYTPYFQIQDQVGLTYFATLASPTYVTRFFFNDGPKITYRYSGSGRLDFEVAKNWTVYGSATANIYRAELANKVRDFTTTAAAVLPGYTETVTEAGVSPNSATSYSLNNSVVAATSLLFQAGGRNTLDSLALDYDFSYSPGRQRVENTGETANLTMNLTGVGWRLDRATGSQYPTIRYTGGPDPQNLDNYGNVRLTTGSNFTWDTVWSARGNVRKTFATRWPVELKAGGVFKTQEREYNNKPAVYLYLGQDRVAGRNPATGVNDDQLSRFAETDYRRDPSTGGYPMPVWPDAGKFSARLASAPEEFVPDTYANLRTRLQSLRNAREEIGAGYLQGKVGLGKFSLLGGVRVETTDVRGTGPVQGPLLNTITDPSSGQLRRETVNEALARIRAETPAQRTARTAAETARRNADPVGAALEEWGAIRRTNTSNYTELFPSIHGRYAFTRNLITRASWATGIGRPNFTSIMPLETANYTNSTVSASNPDLKPQYAKNIDLTLEYYFEPVGMLSAGVFRKDLTDFIYSDSGGIVPTGPGNGFNGLYEGFTLTTSKNGGSARIEGYELAYQQQFTFLPGYLRGLGMFANYTRLTTEGDYGSTTPRTTASVPGFVPKSANLGLSYSYARFSLRGKWNYKSLALFSYSANAASLRYNPSLARIDLSARFKLTRNLDFYADVVNLTAELMIFQGPVAGRRDSISDYGRKVSFGFSGRY
jgi:TonB-dependent receptor